MPISEYKEEGTLELQFNPKKAGGISLTTHPPRVVFPKVCLLERKRERDREKERERERERERE